MALNIGPLTPPATLEEKQAACKQAIEMVMNQQFAMLVRDFTHVFSMVWENRDLTPQQVMDAFGSDATELFVIANLIRNTVNTVKPGTIIGAPPKPVTLNDDGTVTVGK